MTNVGRTILFAVAAIALGAGAPRAVSAQATPPNVLEIVVGNGPFAGTYKAPGDDVVCMFDKKQPLLAASYRKLSSTGTKELGEGGLNISNPDAAGAKHGRAYVRFGDSAKKPTIYDIDVSGSGSGPLTGSHSGPRGQLGFVGKTKDGIQVRITAKCFDLDP